MMNTQTVSLETEGKEHTFKIPERYLTLIFNGDTTGLEKEDVEAWEKFVTSNDLTNGHWSCPDDTESYFSWSNDVHSLGDNVVGVQWVDMI
jgi:hypothetical protein